MEGTPIRLTIRQKGEKEEDVHPWQYVLRLLADGAGRVFPAAASTVHCIVTKYILHDDVRDHGSGNAGLTNFHRVFGGKLTIVVVLCDVLKAVCAVLVGQLLDGPCSSAWFSAGQILVPVFPACWGICFPVCSISRAARAFCPAAPSR